MIPRYSREPMARIWSEENKFASWLKVELAACEALAEAGLIPLDAPARMAVRARCDLECIAAIEKETHHDVAAFVDQVASTLGEDGRYFHFGLTSSDVLDTALAVRLVESADLLLTGVDGLLAVLQERAYAHKDLVMVGRTHGVHAEPITLGLKFALWHAEFQRQRQRLAAARETVRVGKLSGAVGTFAHLPPEVEAGVCRRLGLKPAPLATQIIQRDRHAEYLLTLALIGASVEKVALEIRHLQRTEVREAEEFFAAGQKGSSAMPHKRNPVLSENLCGLARVLRGNALTALENVALWHERDISHSSAERVIIPDSNILLDFMLSRLTGLLKKLTIYPENLAANLAAGRGLVFSQTVLLALVHKGLSRDAAYRLVQRPAMLTWQEGGDFGQRVAADEEIRRYLSPAELADIFNFKHHLRHVDTLFQRVFGEGEG
ncbi:MAG: adenylosuccinate lyase [Deltaproteobacteria bacterium]|nr:adenylosuccinate lyase [Deltaproteobacteria bacterium]